LKNFILIIVFTILGACSAPLEEGISDPFEASNRQIHEINKSLDKNIIRPVAVLYGDSTPVKLQSAVNNIAMNFSLPSNSINYILQGEIKSASESSLKFLVNSTLGVVGIYDASSKLGLKSEKTDFGETMAKWGIGEGQFLVVPFLGPRTSRHFFGTIVDIALNPVRYALKDEDTIISFSPSIVYALSERSRNGDTIDNLRETSIDYYSTLRSIYLQSREINIGDNFEEDQDIFESDLDEFYESEDDKK